MPAPTGSPPTVEFVVALAATVVFLGLDVWFGRTGRRRAHVASVLVTLPLLVTAIVLAERVGAYWSFPRVPLTIHLTFAYAASAAALCAVAAGLLHIRGKVARRIHGRLAWTFVGLALCAVCTGVMIFLVGEPKS